MEIFFGGGVYLYHYENFKPFTMTLPCLCGRRSIDKRRREMIMKEFFRFISKNKLSVFVEVLGISLAFAFTIPLLSFWADKWSIDHGHGYKDIFAVHINIKM